MRRPRNLLIGAVLVLVLLDALGAAWAVLSGLNALADAFSANARMAAPWPMILFQIVTTGVAVAAPRRVAIAGAVLLALACGVSAASGFFDGALAAPGMSRAQVAFQVVLVGWTAVVAVLAGFQGWHLGGQPVRGG